MTGEAPETDDRRADPEHSPWERLHPDTVKVAALIMMGFAVAAAVPTTIGIASGTSLPVALAWVLPGAALLIAAGTGYDALRIRFTRYRVTDARVDLETGIVFKTRRSLARERIRSVDLTAHPLLRYFGLVRVKVGTGETGSGEGSTTERSLDLDSVSRAAGERLRAELLRRGSIADRAGLAEERLATWQPSWIGYAPLSFLTPALAAVLVGVIFQVADWFGRGAAPVEVAMDLGDQYGPWTVLVVGVGVFTVLGAIASLALQAEAWWNYRLDRETGGTLRVQRGLFVSRSLSLEEKRIRGIDVVEPFGIRVAGAARLDVVAIGLKTQDSGSDLSTLVPAAPKAVTLAGAQKVIGPTRVAEHDLIVHPKSARARRLRRAVAATLGAGMIIAGVHLVWSPSTFWSAVLIAVAAAGAGWAFWAAWDSYVALGHALDGAYLVSRRGTIRRSTVRLQRSGIIGWRIKQSLFQRRLGLVTVDATTAAGRGHYATIDADEHEALDFAAEAHPGLLEPFLVRRDSAVVPAEPGGGSGEPDHRPRGEHGDR